MSELIVYVHLIVLLHISLMMVNAEEHKVVSAFGAVNCIWIIAFGYMYAMWQLWQAFAG